MPGAEDDAPVHAVLGDISRLRAADWLVVAHGVVEDALVEADERAKGEEDAGEHDAAAGEHEEEAEAESHG